MVHLARGPAAQPVLDAPVPDPDADDGHHHSDHHTADERGPAIDPGELQGHSHAAPRTPLESPWRLRTTRVSTASEKTYRGSSVATASARPGRFDIPPPSTMTPGASRLITLARPRASRSS